MKHIDERIGYCNWCGGADICTCNGEDFTDNEIIERDYVFEDSDIDWCEDDYGYPYEASMGRLGYEWCENCGEFVELPHVRHITSSGHSEGW